MLGIEKDAMTAFLKGLGMVGKRWEVSAILGQDSLESVDGRGKEPLSFNKLTGFTPTPLKDVIDDYFKVKVL